MIVRKKQLPIGIQNFSELRQNNAYYYVDKTAKIIELINTSKYIFLSRPRRFGKSLTIDTIAELFLGNKQPFIGLYAEKHWNWNVQYPVLRISFGAGTSSANANVADLISDTLAFFEEQWQIDNTKSTISGRFKAIIERCYQTTGKKVVVLVDEYDKPILDNLANHDKAIAVRNELRDFYGIIKESDACIQFAMLTGVSKFSKINLFSGLNNLYDITLDERFSDLCGYTQTELESVFENELMGVDLNALKTWYNGYNWTGESVYNPFDVLLFLSKPQKLFNAYWFETGSPTFLMDMLFDKKIDITSLQGIGSSSQSLSQFDVGDINPVALMFQTGYLTIDTISQKPFGVWYHLKFPNLEVWQSFNQAIIYKFTPNNGLQINDIQSELYQSLADDDLPTMFLVIQRFFASIPYNWHTNNNIAHFEGYWASVFYAYFASIGLHIHVEEPNNQGRMDMTVFFENRVYIFEFKVLRHGENIQNTLNQALIQIQEKQYAQKYQTPNNQIYEIGVVFDEQTKTVELFSH